MKTMVGWDTETWAIAPGLLAPPIVCHSFDYENDRGAELMLREEGNKWVELFLRDGEILAGANIAYDMGCLAAEHPELLPLIFAKYERDEIWDVQIAQTLDAISHGYLRDGEIIDPTTGSFLLDQDGKKTNRYNLWNCVRLCLGRSDAKVHDEWRLRYGELDGKPLSEWPEAARIYPLDDARNHLDVALWQRLNLNNLHDLSAQCRAAFAMHLGAIWGIRADPERVAKLETETVAKQQEMKTQFAKEGFYVWKKVKGEFGWHQVKKAIQARVTQAYMNNPPLTETKKVATDRVTLEDSADELLEKLAEMSKTDKIATYLDPLKQASRGPLNVRANVLLATGRSSYEGFLQLMPRKGGVRACIIARPGYVFCSVDYSAIEMSTLAQVCYWAVGRSKLGDAINAGKEPHSVFGAHLMGISYEEFRHKLKVEKDPFTKDMRQGGKAADFGFPGMMGPAKFVIAKRREDIRVCQVMHTAERCGIVKIREWNGFEYPPICMACVLASDKLKKIFLYDLWTEMPEYFNFITNKLDTNDAAITQYVSGRVRGDLQAPQAANTLFQGLAADGFKRALWVIARESYCDRSSPLFGARLIVAAHDESFLEIPEERASEAATRQSQIMLEEMKKVVPDVAINAEPALMRYWYKDAEPVYVDGKLVPWEPHA